MAENEHYAGASGPDLSHAVTVFVTTVGAPTIASCLAHLRKQDCRFRLHVIDHVAPMHAAFQRMIDDCRTPYYAQVDEDMLLYPHAVRTLHARIDAAGPNVAMFAADLYDVHLDRCIIGVKIFRHEIVRQYPFVASDAFETWQVRQFTGDGYGVVRNTPGKTPVPGQTLGLHGTQWTAQSIYERYTTLERRRRTNPPQSRWLEAYSGEFLRRFLHEPSEHNFFALMGIIAGTLAARSGPAPAKDYRTYAALPGFHALRAFLAAFDHGAASAERAVDTSAAAEDMPPAAL